MSVRLRTVYPGRAKAQAALMRAGVLASVSEHPTRAARDDVDIEAAVELLAAAGS